MYDNNIGIGDEFQQHSIQDYPGGTCGGGVMLNLTGDLFIIRDHCRTVPIRYVSCAPRGDITEFSERSASRMRRYLRECVVDYEYMVTLTYPCGYPSDGEQVKQHLRIFLQKLKRDAGNRECEYSAFWFLEFQSRGAPHFHIFTTHDFNKKWVSRIWYDIVKSDDYRHLAAGTRVEKLRGGRGAAAAYASKYAAKLKQKDVPEGYENVGRFWGVSGCRSTVSASTYVDARHMCNPEINGCMENLKRLLDRALKNKKACMCISENGFSMMVIRDQALKTRIRLTMTRLSLATGYGTSIFDDAEVD